MPDHVCETCTTPYHARNKLAKYCPACRLFHNLRARLETTAKCKVCTARFAPISATDLACSACDPGASRETDDGPPCRICGKRRKLFRDGLVAVCYCCLHDPRRRAEIVKALAKRIRARQATHQPKEATHA